MEANVDKCLALCQSLVEANHQFTFALTIGKDTLSFSTYDQPCKGSACKDRDLKKAAPLQQRRRDRRAADPAVQQKAATYAAAASAGEAVAGAPVQSPAPRPEMGGAAGPARTPAEEAKREPCCKRCQQPVAGHPGGTRGCGANCANLVLTPEKLRHASEEGDLALGTPEKEGREEQCTICNVFMSSDHQCDDDIVDLLPLLHPADLTSTPSRCLQPGAAPPSRVRHFERGIGTSPTTEQSPKDGKTYVSYTFDSGKCLVFIIC
jgi:hypothetical protein